jgi:peptidoglycan hydrolase-like protein with peptidoglycan-binding domain
LRNSPTGKILVIILSVLLCAGVAAARTQKPPAKAQVAAKGKKTSKTSKKKSTKKTRRARGQQGIDRNRARQIQEALIREKYLSGEPTGVWDQRTKDALARFQADNGWQTKVLPDARALIKLGLGPDHTNLLNPETAATASTGRQQ